MSRIRLVVQADDFGMCQAINQGIVRAFRRGILTQAVMMAPCPWFEEAVSLAKGESIPVGMHSTLTSEWDHMRWRPLTAGKSLCEADGTFHRSVEGARGKVAIDEATLELAAQARRMIESGLPPICFDTHMGFVCREAYEHVCEKYRRPFLFPIVERHLELTSFAVLSPRPAEVKREWLMEYLSALEPGDHFLQTHPGVESDELRGLCDPNFPDALWAEDYRVSDLALLTSPEVAARVAELAIELVTVAEIGTASV